jgi:hypothetical protein
VCGSQRGVENRGANSWREQRQVLSRSPPGRPIVDREADLVLLSRELRRSAWSRGSSGPGGSGWSYGSTRPASSAPGDRASAARARARPTQDEACHSPACERCHLADRGGSSGSTTGDRPLPPPRIAANIAAARRVAAAVNATAAAGRRPGNGWRRSSCSTGVPPARPQVASWCHRRDIRDDRRRRRSASRLEDLLDAIGDEFRMSTTGRQCARGLLLLQIITRTRGTTLRDLVDTAAAPEPKAETMAALEA